VTVFLLDANVVIALAIEEHEHHDRVSAWLATVDRIALCPIVEGALVRFVLRVGGTVEAAREILQRMHEDARCAFWPDEVSYARADLSSVRGHRQVTDAYLVSLAVGRGDATVATLDEGPVELRPDRTLLIPVAR
jgi:toxin-antitoxin system PIN domain toxin